MRTVEQQQTLLGVGLTVQKDRVVAAISECGVSRADKKTMLRIMNAASGYDSWQMYCMADTAVRDRLVDIIEGRVDRREVTLTEDEWTDLTTYILLTTKHRVAEAEAWEKLATETNPDSSPKFPHAADNALFWREMSAKLERIRKQIDR